MIKKQGTVASISSFNFSFLDTNIPHNKLFKVLCLIFCFKAKKRLYNCR